MIKTSRCVLYIYQTLASSVLIWLQILPFPGQPSRMFCSHTQRRWWTTAGDLGRNNRHRGRSTSTRNGVRSLASAGSHILSENNHHWGYREQRSWTWSVLTPLCVCSLRPDDISLFSCFHSIVATGRDFAVRQALGDPTHSVAEDGFGGVIVKVLSDRPHASLLKAASVVGIGRSNVGNMTQAVVLNR